MVSDSSTLPSNISIAQNVFKTYKNSTKNKKYEEATKIKTGLIDLIENNIDTTAEGMRLFGRKLREDKHFLESILIFDAASTLSKKIENPENNLRMISFCVYEMMLTSQAMIEDRDLKVVVEDYVIRLMRDKLHDIRSTPSVSERWKCLQVSWVLAYIGLSQGLVDQLKGQEQTLREGLERMDEGFGENKVKHQVYGDLLHDLGHVCYKTSRYEEAASFFKQANDAHKAATDTDGDEEEKRKRHIELTLPQWKTLFPLSVKWLMWQHKIRKHYKSMSFHA